MLMQPRKQILDIWRSLVAYSFDDGRWEWQGRVARNSISDAELLLCILYPATNVPTLRFDRLDRSADDVLKALRGLGGDNEISRVVVRLLIEYMERYRDEAGRPVFPSGDYLKPENEEHGGPNAEQQGLELVDSYSMSVSLTLSTIGFVQVLRGDVRNERTLAQIDHLRTLASERLTAAMTGLLRSFSVRVFDYDEEPGVNLMRMISQGESSRGVARRLSGALTDIRARLRDELSIGSGQKAEQLEDASLLFECGWAWGVVTGADTVPYSDVESQRPGIAEDRPLLYFTGVALDGIEDLFTERTRILGLLDETQQRLSQALQLRFEIALGFWTRLATFDHQRWPVQDVPWRTTDGLEDDYYSLFVVSMVAQRIATSPNLYSPADLVRVGDVLSELANRGRITRRPVEGAVPDPALAAHLPGTRLVLNGSEQLGPRQAVAVSSYASLLLKRTSRLVSMVTDSEQRDRLTELSDAIWRHLQARQMSSGPGRGLWDQPSNVLPVEKTPDEPSWYHTQRVVECLVAASWAMDVPPRASQPLLDLAREYLIEAEHIFDQARLHGRQEEGEALAVALESVEAELERARQLLTEKPGTACVLAQNALQELEKFHRAQVRRE